VAVVVPGHRVAVIYPEADVRLALELGVEIGIGVQHLRVDLGVLGEADDGVGEEGVDGQLARLAGFELVDEGEGLGTGHKLRTMNETLKFLMAPDSPFFMRTVPAELVS